MLTAYTFFAAGSETEQEPASSGAFCWFSPLFFQTAAVDEVVVEDTLSPLPVAISVSPASLAIVSMVELLPEPVQLSVDEFSPALVSQALLMPTALHLDVIVIAPDADVSTFGEGSFCWFSPLFFQTAAFEQEAEVSVSGAFFWSFPSAFQTAAVPED